MHQHSTSAAHLDEALQYIRDEIHGICVACNFNLFVLATGYRLYLQQYLVLALGIQEGLKMDAARKKEAKNKSSFFFGRTKYFSGGEGSNEFVQVTGQEPGAVQHHRMGKYHRIGSLIQNAISERPVYKHESEEVYLYFAKRFDGWYIGGSKEAMMKGEADGILRAKDAAMFPWNTADGKWVAETQLPQVKVVRKDATAVDAVNSSLAIVLAKYQTPDKLHSWSKSECEVYSERPQLYSSCATFC
jgi:hypothetical protein